MTITKIRKRLSDGSHAFNIQLWDDDGTTITLHALDEDTAENCIELLIKVIEHHTVDGAERGEDVGVVA